MIVREEIRMGFPDWKTAKPGLCSWLYFMQKENLNVKGNIDRDNKQKRLNHPLLY